MITIMVIIEIKSIDESKNKSILPKMFNQRVSLKTIFKINSGVSLSGKLFHRTEQKF